MVFFPSEQSRLSRCHGFTDSLCFKENVKRASRLQQLVDSMGNMQTDIKHDADQMDAKDKAIRPAIDAMLKERGLDSIDDLIAKSLAKMTPEEKKQYESVGLSHSTMESC